MGAEESHEHMVLDNNVVNNDDEVCVAHFESYFRCGAFLEWSHFQNLGLSGPSKYITCDEPIAILSVAEGLDNFLLACIFAASVVENILQIVLTDQGPT
jgi:hypothetical protein